MYTRITSNMMMSKYKTNMTQTMSDLSAAGDAVMNERKYQNDYEDPVSATRAYQYRRELSRNEDYSENSSQISSMLVSRESIVQTLSEMGRTVKSNILGAVTDTQSPESRKAFSQQIEQIQKAAIQSLNTSYGDKFIMGGTCTGKVPFALQEDGTVTYRGVPVDGVSKTDIKNYHDGLMTQAEFQKLKADNMKRLREYDVEKQYADLGFGLEYDEKGEVNSNSAFNMVLNGISFLGFGQDKHGNSKNFLQLMGDVAKALDKEQAPYDAEHIKELSENLEKCATDITIQMTQLGSDRNFMKTTIDRLSSVDLNLKSKQNDTEFRDPADVITDFQASNYTYRAALQIGTKILSQSFLDYMR
ncbi:MAG: hypothetical protein ACTTJ2_07030 [Anaerovoracaceae bacterium]